MEYDEQKAVSHNTFSLPFTKNISIQNLQWKVVKKSATKLTPENSNLVQILPVKSSLLFHWHKMPER